MEYKKKSVVEELRAGATVDVAGEVMGEKRSNEADYWRRGIFFFKQKTAYEMELESQRAILTRVRMMLRV